MRIKFHHILLLLIVTATFYTGTQAYLSTFSRTIRNMKNVNVCLLTLDQRSSAIKLKDICIIQYLPEKKALKAIVISNNVRYSISEEETESLRHSFAKTYKETQNKQKAIETTINAVRQIFNNEISIPYYCAGTKNDFKNLLNIVGTYKNKSLFGTAYSSSTYQSSSLDKNTTLSIHANRIVSSINSTIFLFRAPVAISYIQNNLTSNLSLWDLLVFSIELKNLRTSAPIVARLQYSRRSSSAVNILTKLISDNNSSDHKKQQPLRVEVWNASGKRKLAQNVTWLLRKHGYDVIDFGTFPSLQPITLIKDLSDNYDGSYSIVNILNCGEIIATYKPDRFVDISVVLGKDCSLE